jgi:hypothetical protein
VRANSRLPNPTFLAKFLNQDVQLARDFECEGSLLPANFASYERLLELTRLRARTLIVDPVTHAFSYRGYIEKPTFSSLPYAPPAPLDAATLRDQTRVRDFVERVLRFERDTGAHILVAPYLYTRDMDGWPTIRRFGCWLPGSGETRALRSRPRCIGSRRMS